MGLGIIESSRVGSERLKNQREREKRHSSPQPNNTLRSCRVSLSSHTQKELVLKFLGCRRRAINSSIRLVSSITTSIHHFKLGIPHSTLTRRVRRRSIEFCRSTFESKDWWREWGERLFGTLFNLYSLSLVSEWVSWLWKGRKGRFVIIIEMVIHTGTPSLFWPPHTSHSLTLSKPLDHHGRINILLHYQTVRHLHRVYGN